MLLLELALIRWLGSNVLHLSYFSNIVLLASFLGIGLGFLRAKRGAQRPVFFLPLLAGLLLVVLVVPVGVDRASSDLIFFTAVSTSGPPPWVVIPILFALVAAVMTGIGKLVAEVFFELPRLEAYRLDLIGSLIGIGSFTALSFLGAPPLVWGVAVAAMAIALLLPRPTAWGYAGAAVLIGVLAFETFFSGAMWSPYYKIETERLGDPASPVTTVIANGVPHQAVWDAQRKAESEPFYSLPYERSARTEPGRMLIIGAGTGTDVALALANGAEHIDAVEIDPKIRDVGLTANPNRPFDDPRVEVHITDGREFLQNTSNTYDTVILALPDSLTLVAGASQLRLESYLFTQQAMERVREVLNPDGVFAMYNYYRDPWLVGRLGATMAAAFGHAPCVDLNDEQISASLLIAVDPAMQRCGGEATAARLLAEAPEPATDNWPFLYLRDPAIPGLYVAMLLVIIALSGLAVGFSGVGVSKGRRYLDLFLLGAAFLLIETRAVTMFALLFGTTWLVNAIVFGGILIAVLAAVEFTRWFNRRGRGRIPLPIAYAVLLASIALVFVVPPASLLGLPVPLRLITATALTFLPVFTANVIFASRFDDSADPTTAFGMNLLGAMVGGCLEYLALLTGYQALLIIAAALYVGALLLQPKREVRLPSSDPVPAVTGSHQT
jgi:SAM-dependent methyltransferase